MAALEWNANLINAPYTSSKLIGEWGQGFSVSFRGNSDTCLARLTITRMGETLWAGSGQMRRFKAVAQDVHLALKFTGFRDYRAAPEKRVIGP